MEKPEYIWLYDPNRRIYKDDQGNRTQTPNHRLSWLKHRVVGETTRSWILEGMSKTKVPKRPEWPQSANIAFSEEDVDQRAWVENNRHKISDAIRQADYAALKKVAEIIGYNT